jgi:chemosensory pili system protein ChpA (sensor histidine kinase/response regulator)
MSRNILIVEDTETAATTLEIALANIPGVEVARVCDGKRALEYLRGRPIHALVTDLEMPFVDGFELIRQVRSQERFHRLPIVVVSGCQDPRTFERVRELGADAFFGKPWSALAVRRKVEELLTQS